MKESLLPRNPAVASVQTSADKLPGKPRAPRFISVLSVTSVVNLLFQRKAAKEQSKRTCLSLRLTLL